MEFEDQQGLKQSTKSYNIVSACFDNKGHYTHGQAIVLCRVSS